MCRERAIIVRRRRIDTGGVAGQAGSTYVTCGCESFAIALARTHSLRPNDRTSQRKPHVVVPSSLPSGRRLGYGQARPAHADWGTGAREGGVGMRAALARILVVRRMACCTCPTRSGIGRSRLASRAETVCPACRVGEGRDSRRCPLVPRNISTSGIGVLYCGASY